MRTATLVGEMGRKTDHHVESAQPAALGRIPIGDLNGEISAKQFLEATVFSRFCLLIVFAVLATAFPVATGSP